LVIVQKVLNSCDFSIKSTNTSTYFNFFGFPKIGKVRDVTRLLRYPAKRVRDGGDSCATLLLLSDTHWFSRLRARSGHRGPSGCTRCLCPCAARWRRPSGSSFETRQGIADVPSTAPPRPIGMYKGGRSVVDKDGEDDKDEYRAPTLRARCRVMGHSHWGTDLLGCMASGADEMPLPPRWMHTEHKAVFTLVQAARGDLT
jgi:hypothetical protein